MALLCCAGCGSVTAVSPPDGSGGGPAADAPRDVVGPAADAPGDGVSADARVRAALSFDGVDDLVLGGASGGLEMGASGTIEAWVQIRRHTAHARLFRKVRGDVEDKGLLIEAGYARVYFYKNAPTYIEHTSRIPIPLDAWTHVAGVYDGTAVRIYLNGVLADTAPATGEISDGDGDVFIGGSGTGDTLDGILAEVRVSSSARYRADFAPQATLPADADTLAVWHLDEGAGATVADGGPAALAGTLANGARWVSVTRPPALTRD